MSAPTPDVHELLRLASLQWHGAQTALLELYGLRPPEGDPRMPGYEMVIDFLMSHAPCGNGPLDRAIAKELGESNPYWYAHGAEPPKPDEAAVLVAQLRARIAELEPDSCHKCGATELLEHDTKPGRFICSGCIPFGSST